MKNRWVEKTLGEVCVVERGSSPRPIESYLTDSFDGVNWVKIGDTKNVNKYIYSTKQKITKAGAEKSRRVDPGDFILSNSMSFGKPYVMATSGYVHDGWFVLRLLESIDTDFFHYLLSSDFVQAQFMSLAAGSVVKNISKDLVKRAVLPIPPLSEQKRIVSIVDQAFEGIDRAIANTKKNLTNARELFESYLNAIFTQKGDGWVEKTVGEVADHSLGKMLDKRKNTGVLKPYLRNLNVRWFEFDLSDLLEMPFEESERKKCTAIKGDVLICEGGYPGRAAIWQKDEPIYFQKAIHRVRFKNAAHSKWFLYFIYLSDSNNQLKQYFTGAGIQHFTGQSLHRFKLPIPPTPVIENFVEQFDELRNETQRLEAIYQQKLAALTELKQSILQKAFTGELTADTANQTTKKAEEAIAA